MSEFKKMDVLIGLASTAPRSNVFESFGEAIFLEQNEGMILLFLSEECPEDVPYMEIIKDIDIMKAVAGEYEDVEGNYICDCLIFLDIATNGKFYNINGEEILLELKTP